MVTQNPVAVRVTSNSETTGATVVSWRPALVLPGGVLPGGVFYTVRLNGVVAVAGTANTSVTLRDLIFDTSYTVTVEPLNRCGVAGTPLLGTIKITGGEIVKSKEHVESCLCLKLTPISNSMHTGFVICIAPVVCMYYHWLALGITLNGNIAIVYI